MFDSMTLPLPRYEVRRAGRAMSALLKDPDDLPQVFSLLEALAGTTPHRMLYRFRRSATGQRMLLVQPDIVPALRDRAALRRMPEGSLGRAYLAFVEAEGISADGIVDASARGQTVRDRPSTLAFVRRRMRDTHDLWHAATGYKGDVLGEASLLAFTLAQTWNLGVALIVGAALVKGRGTDAGRVILDGYRRGRAAAWLPAQEWEALLALPLDEVRRRLNLGAPPDYVPVRTAELRSAGIL
jgi:ubiquinone biosynthesis protein COQ4